MVHPGMVSAARTWGLAAGPEPRVLRAVADAAVSACALNAVWNVLHALACLPNTLSLNR